MHHQRICNPTPLRLTRMLGSMEQICPRIWAEEDAVNPGFSSKMMSATGGMVLAIKSYSGHGILVSPVFGNGDVATFQINLLDSNACAYVAGSAKNRYGEALPDIKPNVGGGGSGNVIVGGGGRVSGFLCEGPTTTMFRSPHATQEDPAGSEAGSHSPPTRCLRS